MQLKNKKGFTLIELLIASLIILFVSIGFLRGILFFMQYNMQTKMKDKATEVNKIFTEYFYNIPYTNLNPTYPAGWGFSTCTTSGGTTICSFENSDTDSDGIPDFYDPYNGDNDSQYTNPLSSFGNYLGIIPNSSGGCDCSPGFEASCSSGLPDLCVTSIKSNINNQRLRIYTAITFAKIATSAVESGKAVGVITWYFDPITKKYKAIRSIVFKENNQ